MALDSLVVTVSDDTWCRRADRLAGEISSALIGLTDDVTTVVESAQRSIGEALEADRCTLIEYSDDAPRATYQWASDDVPPVDMLAHASRLTWLLDRMGGGEGAVVVLDRIPADLPPEAARTGLLEHLRDAVVGSAVVIPVVIAGQRVFALAVEAARAGREWPPPLVARLRLLAEILGGTLYRSRQGESLRRYQAEIARLTGVPEVDPVRMITARAERFGFDDIIGESAALQAVWSGSRK